MRLIDADEVMKTLCERRCGDKPKGCPAGFCTESLAVDCIPSAQLIDPVKHGKWIMRPDPYGFFDEIPVCSECGCTTKMRETYKYCPMCGAIMDKGGEV